MRHLLGIALSLCLAGLALAGEQLPQGQRDTYNLNGSPNGGETDSGGGFGNLTIDPDGFGHGSPGVTGWWNSALGGYQSSDGEIRFFISCVGHTPDGGCLCWMYEIWMKSNNPPFLWEKAADGLTY